MAYFKNESNLPFSQITYGQRNTVINAKMEGKAEELAPRNGGVYVTSGSLSIMFNTIYRVVPEPITFYELVELIREIPNSSTDVLEKAASEIIERGLADET